MARTSARREHVDREDRLDAGFRALGDRTRRALLRALAEGDASIGELAKPFDMSLVAVSKHIKVLEKAGLITRSVEGRVHRCSLAREGLDELERWVETQQAFWDRTLDALAAFVEAEFEAKDDEDERETREAGT